MESRYFEQSRILHHSLVKMKDACGLILSWMSDVATPNDLVSSPQGMKTLAATCMLIESIGEAAKKIDSHVAGFMMEKAPEIDWRGLKGMRDYIAHGYFQIDADIVFDAAKNEIPILEKALQRILSESDFTGSTQN